MKPKPDGYSPYDDLAQADTSSSPWQAGSFVPQLDLLRDLLTIPVADKAPQQSGRHAKAFDVWVAHELRRLGFPDDSVWPRRTQPRVLPEDLSGLAGKIRWLEHQLERHEKSDSGTRKLMKDRELRSAIRNVYDHPMGGTNAYILGDFYAKQIDVGMSSWRRGPDILVSTKTMFSSYLKNLKNRHEEAVGEVDSLRRRHPMATMGYAYLVHQSVYNEEGAYPVLNDILTRLRRTGEAFDSTMLLVATWDDSHEFPQVTQIDQPDDKLDASRFFSAIADNVTSRSPIHEHREVRYRRGDNLIAHLPEFSDDDLLNEDSTSDEG